MRLRKFRVQAFRCIHDSGDIVVGDLAAFVGRNESGKTTILQALMLLNVDEIISELDLCDEMTDVLKSEIKIVEGQFDLLEEETEMIKEKFPHLDIKKVNIFRTNKNPEIQYDFEDAVISQEENRSVKSWKNLKTDLISFTETIPTYIQQQLDTGFFETSTPTEKKIIQNECGFIAGNFDVEKKVIEWNINKIS